MEVNVFIICDIQPSLNPSSWSNYRVRYKSDRSRMGPVVLRHELQPYRRTRNKVACVFVSRDISSLLRSQRCSIRNFRLAIYTPSPGTVEKQAYNVGNESAQKEQLKTVPHQRTQTLPHLKTCMDGVAKSSWLHDEGHTGANDQGGQWQHKQQVECIDER
jgi:hypothetical protein